MVHSPTLTVMISAARKAARALVRDFGEVEQLQVSQKGPADFVTNADLKAEKTLIHELLHARPDYGVIAEESGVTHGVDTRHYWIIDPLDGTLNFMHGIPHFAISIGLVRAGDVVAGLLLRRTMQMLGFARKAGEAISGREKVEAQLRSGKIGVLITASDAAEDGKAKLQRLAQAVSPDMFYVTWLTAAELSLAFGRDNVIHAAITQGRLSDRFRHEAERLLGFRRKLG